MATMPRAVNIPIGILGLEAAPEPPSKTYRLDLDAGRIVGTVDGVAAVEQAIRKAIITPRFRCLIYDSDYGSEIKDAILLKSANASLAAALVPKLVQEALSPDPRVVRAYDFVTDPQPDHLNIAFRADTVFGETDIEGVII